MCCPAIGPSVSRRGFAQPGKQKSSDRPTGNHGVSDRYHLPIHCTLGGIPSINQPSKQRTNSASVYGLNCNCESAHLWTHFKVDDVIGMRGQRSKEWETRCAETNETGASDKASAKQINGKSRQTPSKLILPITLCSNNNLLYRLKLSNFDQAYGAS